MEKTMNERFYNAYTEIDYLRDQADNRDDEQELKKLDEINQFIMSIEKKYEIA